MWIERGKWERVTSVLVFKHCFCACVRGNTQEGEVKRKMTQEGRGVRARKRGQKEEGESWWCCVGALVVE